MLLGRVRHTVIPAGCGIGARVVITALVLLPILAFASPPDPVWVQGIYDGTDGDDIVTLVTETVASEAGVPCQLLFPTLSPEDVIGRGFRNYGSSRALPPARSPPLASEFVTTRLDSSSPRTPPGFRRSHTLHRSLVFGCSKSGCLGLLTPVNGNAQGPSRTQARLSKC